MPVAAVESELRRLARERIVRGTLHSEPVLRVWGGKGDGRPCSLCLQRILAHEVEYDVIVGEQALHFHMLCHGAWQLESVRAMELRRLGSSI